MDNGANMSSRNKQNRTPLHVASQIEHLVVVRWFLDRVANVTALDVYRTDPSIRGTGPRKYRYLSDTSWNMGPT